ncbi:hypothetical protein HUA76_43855 [Myxococcus sp. CA056]|uniref:hypothetical protein n=1 Tax=Myxococcus sp. CA056 TaxID=2741740 RepID=UPI00157AE000|nr:hypothetical protein [Myxococcus sp. CA056]NTX17718.1 hypothetical protein [Myxococcus sp. CA056]
MVIPSIAKTSVAIDTSALSDIVKSNSLTDQFTKTILSRPMNLLIPKVAISELVALETETNALRMLQRLQKLCRHLGERFCPSLDHLDIIKAELRGWQTGPPVHERGWRSLARATNSSLLEAAQTLPEVHKQLRDVKTRLFELDRSAYLTRPVEVTPHEARQLIVDATPSESNEPVIILASELSDGGLTPEKIVSNPLRFKATHALSHLSKRLWIANSVDRKLTTPAEEAVIGMWRTKRAGKGEGTWHDISIAGASAYADIFLTNDRNQLSRCKFLKERGLLTFAPTNLPAFLGNTSG